MVDVVDVAEKIERISNLVSLALTMLLTVQLLGDVLGINVFELARQAITRPWVLPVEWIERYYWLWYSMQWALLITVLADQAFTWRYMQARGQPPPPEYVRWVSLVVFLLSFWLYLVFRYATYAAFTVFSAISLAYTMFARRGQE